MAALLLAFLSALRLMSLFAYQTAAIHPPHTMTVTTMPEAYCGWYPGSPGVASAAMSRTAATTTDIRIAAHRIARMRRCLLVPKICFGVLACFPAGISTIVPSFSMMISFSISLPCAILPLWRCLI